VLNTLNPSKHDTVYKNPMHVQNPEGLQALSNVYDLC
jgi:hypothetical protein